MTVWTTHAIEKMIYYGLSENKVRNVLWRPTRTEEGIAPDTIAVMQPYGSSKKPKEIWVMYQNFTHQNKSTQGRPASGRKKRCIISAWRYPAVSPKGKEIYIPNDVQELLDKIRQNS